MLTTIQDAFEVHGFTLGLFKRKAAKSDVRVSSNFEHFHFTGEQFLEWLVRGGGEQMS